MRFRIVVAAVVLIAGGRPAFAQIPGIDVHLGARAGLFSPLGKIGEDSSGRETTVSPGLAFGASVEFDIPLSPINVRANVDAAMGRSIEVEGQEVPGSEVDIIAITGDLVFRPLPRVIFQPYLLAGAGIKRYTLEGGPEPETDFTGHLGVGGDLKLGALSVFGEVSDYISKFDGVPDSHLQNDVFVMVGFRIGLL
jgi:hypothetical protein